jgi:hypothetical protein
MKTPSILFALLMTAKAAIVSTGRQVCANPLSPGLTVGYRHGESPALAGTRSGIQPCTDTLTDLWIKEDVRMEKTNTGSTSYMFIELSENTRVRQIMIDLMDALLTDAWFA